MNSISNVIFSLGLEAFEDLPEVPTVVADPVVTDTVVAVAAAAAALEEVKSLESERDIALGNSNLAALDSEIVVGERSVNSTTDAIEHIETVQAGLESFVEAGSISPRTAQLLQHQINYVMGSIGKSGAPLTNGGLENFGEDPDGMMLALTGGLEALDTEKKSLAKRAWSVITALFATIKKFLAEVFNQNKRVRERADSLSASIKGKPAKEVSLSSQYMLVGKDYTNNITADLKKFKEGLVKGATTAIAARGDWYFKVAANVIEDITLTPTLDAALSAAKKLVPPAVKGVSVSVKDEDGMALKRSEVYLGNYAIFELINKSPAPTDADSAVSFINAMVKSRISIQQAKIQSPEAKTLNINESTAQQIINAVKDVLGASDDLKPVVDKLEAELTKASGSAKGDNDATANEKDVKRIVSAAVKIPGGLTDTISQLPRMVTKAALNVSEAALDLVAQLGKGEKAAKPAAEETPAEA